MQQILIAVNELTDAHLQRIQDAAKGWAQIVRIDQPAAAAEYQAALLNAQVVFGWPPPQGLADSPNIRLAQLCSVGYDPYLTVSLDQKKNFSLCNAHGVPSVPVAEQTIAMMFALTRRVNVHVRDQQQHTWRRADEYRIVDGATMCVVGLGAIGSAIAVRCAALGMKVIGVTRTGLEPTRPPVSRIYGFSDIKHALAEADHVAVSMPATPMTEGVFDESMFRSMKQGACFYNVSRGSLVVEPDLVRVLKDGHLWGAGLDVFATEPLPEDHPFWDMPNVVMAPHVGGRYVQEFDHLCDLFVKNLERYRDQKELINRVDLTK